MNITGTSYFVSLAAALEYYTPYGENLSSVKRKIAQNEISIGVPPQRKIGESLRVIEGRYHIVELIPEQTARKNQEVH